MSDRYIEKAFLVLLFISLLLHLGVFAALYYLPAPSPVPPREPVFVDLQQLPEPLPLPDERQQEAQYQSEQRSRVLAESAPRGDAARDTQVPEQQSGSPPIVPGSSITSLLKPKGVRPPPVQNLFPGANRLAQLEESYRRKFESDIAEGDTRFLNSDDIVFGSFLRRFEGAVYGVWRYPQEAAMRGIEGITPVRITFNRRGEITHVEQLESSGHRILDEEVLRTLRALGPMGGFPKGYDKDEFHLIAFFQYGGTRRSLR